MHVGIVIDHPKRDLAGAVLLAHELAKRHADVSIVPMYEQGVDLPQLGLDAIVLNYVRDANRALVEGYAAAGLQVYVLDTEGGVLAEKGGNEPHALARYVIRSGYPPLLSGYFFWGSTLRDAFAEEGVLPAERLHVVGCPRFDFVAPPWQKMLDRPRSGYILVNANFPLVNPRFSASPGSEKRAMTSAGWDAAYVDRLIGDMRAVFRAYLADLRKLAEARPAMQFLVRPHPFENEAPYRETFAGLANVVVEGEGTALVAINNARAVVHLNCGTAIEAVMLRRLPIQLDYLNTDATRNHATLPAKASRLAASFAEVCDILDNLDAETARFPFAERHERFIRPFFHLADGKAAARVADVLTREVKPVGWRSSRSAMVNARANPSLGQLAKGTTSLLTGSAATSTVRSWAEPAKREKIVRPAEINALLTAIEAVDTDAAAPGGPARRARGLLGLPLASISIRAA